MATKSISSDAARLHAQKEARALLISLISRPLEEVHLELVDIEVEALGTPDGVIRVLVEHLGSHERGPRIDLDGIAEATKLVDALIEANDPIEQAFTLEVSSPGLERPLRTPAHFERFRDAEIAVKTVAGTAGERRVQGRLESCDTDPAGVIVIAGRTISYNEIERARTVFRWGEEAPPTANGEPRKKGALPKGQRPVHPKALLAAAKTVSEQPLSTEDEVVFVPHESTVQQISDAPAALAPPQLIPTEVTP